MIKILLVSRHKVINRYSMAWGGVVASFIYFRVKRQYGVYIFSKNTFGSIINLKTIFPSSFKFERRWYQERIIFQIPKKMLKNDKVKGEKELVNKFKLHAYSTKSWFILDKPRITLRIVLQTLRYVIKVKFINKHPIAERILLHQYLSILFLLT